MASGGAPSAIEQPAAVPAPLPAMPTDGSQEGTGRVGAAQTRSSPGSLPCRQQTTPTCVRDCLLVPADSPGTVAEAWHAALRAPAAQRHSLQQWERGAQHHARHTKHLKCAIGPFRSSPRTGRRQAVRAGMRVASHHLSRATMCLLGGEGPPGEPGVGAGDLHLRGGLHRCGGAQPQWPAGCAGLPAAVAGRWRWLPGAAATWASPAACWRAGPIWPANELTITIPKSGSDMTSRAFELTACQGLARRDRWRHLDVHASTPHVAELHTLATLKTSQARQATRRVYQARSLQTLSEQSPSARHSHMLLQAHLCLYQPGVGTAHACTSGGCVPAGKLGCTHFLACLLTHLPTLVPRHFALQEGSHACLSKAQHDVVEVTC